MMQIPLSITVHGRPLSRTMETEIRRLAEDLGRIVDKLITCRIFIRSGHIVGTADALYAILIDLRLPGGHISIQNTPNRHLATAIQQAFRKARTVVNGQRRRASRELPETPLVHPPATISYLDPQQGYGYISTWDGRRLYFDRPSVMNGGFTQLHQGMAVRFLETLEGEQQRISMLAPI